MFDPCRVAIAATVVVVAFLFVVRRQGPQGVEVEKRLLAAFLVGMPFVYVARALVAGAQSSLWWEVLAVPLFSVVAILGLKKSPWFLVAGIASHGMAWDAWHYRRSAYIPNWYSACCLLLDLALAGYLLLRVSAYTQPKQP